MLELEQPRDRQMHAIGGRTVDVIGIGVVARRAHGDIERQGVARAAAIAVRSDDGDGAQWIDRPAERLQALCPIAVVIGK